MNSKSHGIFSFVFWGSVVRHFEKSNLPQSASNLPIGTAAARLPSEKSDRERGGEGRGREGAAVKFQVMRISWVFTNQKVSLKGKI